MMLFVVYDTLYEEYQTPFVMKNEKIAKNEFDIFVKNVVEKASEKEKENVKSRYILCSYGHTIRFDKDSGHLITEDKTYQPLGIVEGGDENE